MRRLCDSRNSSALVVVGISFALIASMCVPEPNASELTQPATESPYQQPNVSATTSSTTFVSPVSPVSPVQPTMTPSVPYALSGCILFHSDRGGTFDIYSLCIDSQGEETRQITDDPKREIEPVWCPRLERIVFAAGDGLRTEIYSMTAQGIESKQLTSNGAANLSAKCVENDDAIVYHSNRNGKFQVYLMDVGGEDLQFTDTEDNNAMPSISPDGRYLVFMSDRDDTNGDLYKQDLETGDTVRLTDSVGADILPQWSPDGDEILFVSTRMGPLQVYKMRSDGTEVTRLSIGENIDSSPSWAEGGKSIVFSSFRDRDWEIYVMLADGSQQTRLTDSPGEDSYPSWSGDTL
jgi:TolB protein